MYIDLHTHSKKSDGSMTPAGVVEEAKKAGLSAISLTDHDTIDGVYEAIKKGEELGVEVVPGIELSSKFKTETHILGYYIDTENKQFLDALAEIKNVRLKRNYDTAKNLQSIGINVTYEDARRFAGDSITGRAHFAKAMVEKGYVSSVKEAFDLYLASDKPGYSRVQTLTPSMAVQLIKAAGGLAFVAHLHLTKLDSDELRSFLTELKAVGLDGVEGYYTEYTDEMQADFMALAKELDLGICGGTDFHGEMKPHIKIGKGLGNMAIPYTVLENIKKLR